MNTLLLGVHVLLALLTMGISARVLYAAYKRRSGERLALLWGSFGVTALSGGVMLVVMPVSLGHVCAAMSAYVVGIAAIHALYRARVSAIV